MSELRGLEAVYAELAEQGGQLLAIAVDPPEDARRVVKRNNLSYPVLCDTDRQVIRDYGLVHAGGSPDGRDIAIPALVLINTNGRIVWRYVSKRPQDRMDPANVLEEVRKLKS